MCAARRVMAARPSSYVVRRSEVQRHCGPALAEGMMDTRLAQGKSVHEVIRCGSKRGRAGSSLAARHVSAERLTEQQVRCLGTGGLKSDRDGVCHGCPKSWSGRAHDGKWRRHKAEFEASFSR